MDYTGVIQEDFSIKIDGYPLLKKFRGLPEYSTQDFLEKLMEFNLLKFEIILGDPVKIKPIFYTKSFDMEDDTYPMTFIML